MKLLKNTKNPIKLVATPALAIAAAFLLVALSAGCKHKVPEPTPTPAPTIPSGSYYKSGMTDTQYATASSDPITVNVTTKSLVVSGATGKKIYMSRMNPTNETVEKVHSRKATISSGATPISSSSVKTSLSGNKAFSSDDFADTIPGLFEISDDDPHKKIYDLSIKNLENAKKNKTSHSARTLSKNNSNDMISASVQNYAEGAKVTFNALNMETMDSFVQMEFDLIVSETNYNIWVHADDPTYKDDPEDYKEYAEDLGKNFINGYELVQHLYGEPSSVLYNEDDSVYGPMNENSRTGLKINIMLYEMLEKGHVYGFVYHGDIRHDVQGSNEGRFVYLDSKIIKDAKEEAYSTAQHEFSHTISFNQKTLKNKLTWTYWYGELLAMNCEDMMQAYFGIDDDRDINDKLGHTPKARIPQANADSAFNGISGENSLAYACIFQFGAWLTRNFGGPKFIKALSTNPAVDMDSIIKAVNEMGETQYTTTTLLQKFAGDMLVYESGKGFDQYGKTYSGDANYTHTYQDSSDHEQTYLYPLTPINLWAPFYGWCNINKSPIVNESMNFSDLPDANIYKRASWGEGKLPEQPALAYKGPALFNSGRLCADLQPYSNILFCLGQADSDSVTIDFDCVDDVYFSDVITIWVK